MSWSTGYARGKKNIERYALPIVIVAGKTLRVKCEFIDKKVHRMNFTTLQNLFWDGIRQRPNFHWISCSRKDTNGQHSNKEADSGMFVLSIDYTMTLWNHAYVFFFL